MQENVAIAKDYALADEIAQMLALKPGSTELARAAASWLR